MELVNWKLKITKKNLLENGIGRLTWQASTFPLRNPAHNIPGVITPLYIFSLLQVLLSIIFTAPFWSILGIVPKGRRDFIIFAEVNIN